MRVVPILALMLLSACSRSSEVADELPNSSLAGAPREAMPETRIEATLARPVTTTAELARTRLEPTWLLTASITPPQAEQA